MRHLQVREIMNARPITVTPATSLHDVIDILVDRGIGCVPVVSPWGQLVGMVTGGQLLSKRELQRDPASRPAMHLTYRARRAMATAETAGELMSMDLVTVPPGATVPEAVQLMEQHKVDCMPVTGEGRKLLGAIYPPDLLRAAFLFLELGGAGTGLDA
jgi:CBS domain-containing protein